MSKVVNLPSGVHLSVRGFCDESGQDRETVTHRIRESGIEPSGKRGGYPVYRLRDLLKAAYTTAEDGGLDPDKLRPFERHAHYKAEKEKLAVEQERGELIPRIEVEQEQARIAKIVAHGLETLPDVLERDCGLAPDVVARMERHIDAVRERMYAELTEGEDAVAAG